MGYVPPRFIHPPQSGVATSEAVDSYGTIGQIANVGYRMSDFTPMPEQITDFNVTNEQGMQFSLAYEEEVQ